jgi:hypothetical protein
MQIIFCFQKIITFVPDNEIFILSKRDDALLPPYLFHGFRKTFRRKAAFTPYNGHPLGQRRRGCG